MLRFNDACFKQWIQHLARLKCSISKCYKDFHHSTTRDFVAFNTFCHSLKPKQNMCAEHTFFFNFDAQKACAKKERGVYSLSVLSVFMKQRVLCSRKYRALTFTSPAGRKKWLVTFIFFIKSLALRLFGQRRHSKNTCIPVYIAMCRQLLRITRPHYSCCWL